MGAIVFILIILTFSQILLRLWIVGTEKEEIAEEGKDISLWGKVILAVISLITFIVIIAVDSAEGKAIKWFWMILIIAANGFQSFIDWKYLKGSKQYMVSLIVLLIGVTMVYYLY
ncbi:DUF4181 domain-containing protein [Paenibacillus marinisediminis]